MRLGLGRRVLYAGTKRGDVMVSVKRLLSGLVVLMLLASSRQIVAATGVVSESRLPSAAGGASGIVAGPDGGSWWFTEYSANKIGAFAIDGRISEFSIPTPNSGPLGITSDDQAGVIWFTEFNANKIGKITLDGVITEFSIPTPASGPVGIAAASGSVWFSESNVNRIGRLAQDGSFSEVAIPTPASMPMGVLGTFGTVWFAEFQGNKIGIISVGAGVTLTEVPLPTANAGPLSLATDDLGRVWFVEATANKIGILNQGAVSEFSVPSPNSGLSGISADFYGGLGWFTERATNKIGSVTPEGRFTEYAIPTSASDPFGIARFAFDGQVIFTERSGNAVTRLQPDAVLVLAAQTVGGWTTEFDFANVEDQPISLFGSSYFPPSSVCAGSCPPEIRLPLSPHGSGNGNASQTSFGPLFGGLFFRSLEDGILPGVKARLVHSAAPSKSIDIPVIRLSTVAALDPSVLVFPSALRTNTGGHCNLLIAEIGSNSLLRLPTPDTGLQLLLEAFSPDGQLVGSTDMSVRGGDALYLVDVLSQLGVAELSGGAIRVTRVGGGGIMWGYLFTVTDEGAIGVSMGATP